MKICEACGRPLPNTALMAARSNAGLSLSDLAAVMHVRQATISHWETGRQNPQLPYLGKLAEALNLSLAEVLGLFTEPEALSEQGIHA